MWDKYDALTSNLVAMGRVLVAYSGGVDSTFLLKAATDALGDDALGAFVSSPLMTEEEREEALAIASAFNARVIVLTQDEGLDPQVLENTPDRCFFCKANICETLKTYAAAHDYDAVVDGANVNDLGDYRPGARAAAACGMQSPLQIAGITKQEIRTLAKALDLPNWDRPSAACLASRIPYGTPITEAALARIAQAESLLRDLGFGQLRVRHHKGIARIEVPPADFTGVLTERDRIVNAFKDLGYAYVTLDLSGFRSGSMNEVIDTHGR